MIVALIDIDDIMQLIIANKKQIDWNYLFYRLKWRDLMEDFKEILKVFKADIWIKTFVKPQKRF